MKKSALIMTALAAASLVLVAATSPSPSPSQPPADRGGMRPGDPPLITVSATAEVQRKPELAIANLGVEFRESTAAAASEKAGAAMEQVVKAIEAIKAPGMQIQTSGISLSPAYNWQTKDGQRSLIGYDAVSMLRIRVEDPKVIGKVIDAAIGAGANRLEGITFEVKEAVGPRQEAIRMAAEAARQKADTLASALGLKITSVVTATTTGDSPRPWEASNRRVAMAAPDGVGATVEPGLITFQAEATVTFAAE